MAEFSFVMFSLSFKCRVVFQRKQLFGFSTYDSQRAVTKGKKKKRQNSFNFPTMMIIISERWHHCYNCYYYQKIRSYL